MSKTKNSENQPIEVTTMSQVAPEPVVEPVLSKEEKKKLRRAQIENASPLDIDSKYKRPGFRQRLVNVEPGNMQKRELEGYRPIVAIPDALVGNGTLDSSHNQGGSYVEVEVGRKQSQKAIWMEISEEDALILDEIRDDKAKEQESMIYKSDIPEDVRVGKITKEK